jgi:hypothetical protein
MVVTSLSSEVVGVAFRCDSERLSADLQDEKRIRQARVGTIFRKGAVFLENERMRVRQRQQVVK